MKSTNNTIGRKILVCDLRREDRLVKKQILEEIGRVADKGWYILGNELQSLEKEFSEYCGVSHAVGVASGTEALQLALMAFSIGKNDEVVTVPNTAIPTVMAIIASGARPKFVDIREDTFNMDVHKLNRAITKRTKAIIAVHLYGNPCDMDGILKVAQKYGLYVIEDACQAHGALYKNVKVGAIGDIAAFSFYPTKNLGCYGDGGMVVTNNRKIADKIRLMRNYGQSTRYKCSIFGINSRLDEIQAAVLRIKLRHLDDFNAKRIKIANLYREHLEDLKTVVLPKHDKDAKPVYHLYVIRCRNRDKLMKYLAANYIESQIHYPIPLHLQQAFRYLGYKRRDFGSTEKICQEILSLPIFPELNEKEVSTVCVRIKDFYKKNGRR